ncbi:hypothetical protein [Methylobacterium sp. WL2]|uniref:hypothetical protein n=1 Tax=Methylobacterium sp. WL2 TaxID=2603902 RepID=UPI0011C74008|nr:hypothetical protein [Methylobacterium sp. WL2]TXN51702.1 hypothetical protein FV241_29980 [Methylobacterium sp. WL2]
MRVVSERSEAEIRTHEVEAKVRVTLRRLAANIMRAARGSGSSAELGAQMVACIEAMEAYRDVVGTWVPSWDLNQMLDADAADAEGRTFKPSAEDQARWDEDGSTDRALAERDIRNACLQMTASMLLNQSPQKARGEHDLYEGVRRLEASRECSRAYYQAKYTTTPRAQKKPKPQ